MQFHVSRRREHASRARLLLPGAEPGAHMLPCKWELHTATPHPVDAFIDGTALLVSTAQRAT
jgi:hypothetical protein